MMKAVRFLGHGELSIDEVDRPVPDKDSVIIKVKASALCGSELHRFLGPPEQLGTTLNSGHEVVGEIVEAPKGSAYQPGQRVGARVVQGCGQCDWCRQGEETGCANKRYDTSNGHSEYFKLGLRGIHPLPDDVDWIKGVILSGDGLGVPARCARRLGDTRDKKVVVLGLGPVGLSCSLVQSWRGAQVMGIEVSPYRLNLASKLGAVATVDPSAESVKDRVMDWTDGHGADIVILAVARNDALVTAFKVVRRHGTVFQVAELGQATMTFNAAFIQREVHMTGSWYYTSSDWPHMLELDRSGLPYAKLITHVVPFEQAQEAFDRFVSGQSGKVVLTYE